LQEFSTCEFTSQHHESKVKGSKNIKKLIKSRKFKKSNHEKKFIKPIKILKKSTGSVRFHKLETRKRIKMNSNRKKPEKNRAKTKPNRKNRKNRAKPKKPSQTGLNQFLS